MGHAVNETPAAAPPVPLPMPHQDAANDVPLYPPIYPQQQSPILVGIPYPHMIAPPPQFTPYVAYSPSLSQKPPVQSPLSSSQGIPPPRSPTFSQAMQYSPVLLSNSQGVPALSLSQGIPPPLDIPPPLSFSQGILPPSPSLSLSQGIPPPQPSLSFSQGIPLPQPSLSFSQGIPPPSLSHSQGIPSPLHSPIVMPQDPALQNFGFVTQPIGYQLPPDVMANPSVMTTLNLAQQYNLKVRWARYMEITVHGAHGIIAKNNKDGTSNAYCKLAIAGHLTQTKPAKKTTSPSWEETYKFKVHKPCNLTIALYNKNIVFSDEELGSATITPRQLVEGAKVNFNLPLSTQGQVNITIGLSNPWPDNFRFLLSHDWFSFGDYHIKDANANNVFKIEGNWPSSFHFKDMLNQELLDIRRRSMIAIEPSFDIYMPRQNQPILSITKQLSFGGATYRIEGNNGSVKVEGDIFTWNFKFYDDSGRCVAHVTNMGQQSLMVDVAPDQDIPLLLACVMVIGKTCQR